VEFHFSKPDARAPADAPSNDAIFAPYSTAPSSAEEPLEPFPAFIPDDAPSHQDQDQPPTNDEDTTAEPNIHIIPTIQVERPSEEYDEMAAAQLQTELEQYYINLILATNTEAEAEVEEEARASAMADAKVTADLQKARKDEEEEQAEVEPRREPQLVRYHGKRKLIGSRY